MTPKKSSKKKPAAKKRMPAPPGPKNVIGPKVRELREKLGIFQEQLAQKVRDRGLPMDRVQMVRLEGQQRYVSDQELMALSEILSVSPLELLCGALQTGTGTTSPARPPTAKP